MISFCILFVSFAEIIEHGRTHTRGLGVGQTDVCMIKISNKGAPLDREKALELLLCGQRASLHGSREYTIQNTIKKEANECNNSNLETLCYRCFIG